MLEDVEKAAQKREGRRDAGTTSCKSMKGEEDSEARQAEERGARTRWIEFSEGVLRVLVDKQY